MMLPEDLQEGDAVHTGHLQIKRDDVGIELFWVVAMQDKDDLFRAVF